MLKHGERKQPVDPVIPTAGLVFDQDREHVSCGPVAQACGRLSSSSSAGPWSGFASHQACHLARSEPAGIIG